jgi:class 3 adenylate cyclase/DNA-binding SARP family transcriptional activator/tetratricopeptide (TPR) repeat protein
VDFGILGPLAVWKDGTEVKLGAAMERKLLAVMLLHANEVMSKERLAHALWGEQPPGRPDKGVQVRVSELRKRLGTGVVETSPLGYTVRLDRHTLDLERFEQLLDEGKRLLGEGAPQQAGEVLREALALWRGEPLADFRYDEFAATAIGRLEERRLIARELRIEADLAVGRSAESVPELEALVREHPLRETLCGLLMLALYRSGRQADALAVMQETRTKLREELGLEPSQRLQELERLILNQDPSLDLPVAPAPAPVPAPTPTRHLELVTPRAQRKVVTVLFADVTDSTLLGETFDPEVVRDMLARYFERMKAAAERHGGVVEKFIGDAVMAVFGIPAVHEDDALRALRAALEMREAIVELGMEGRVGIESGECVVGTGERLVTGRAVTTAARLEQAAQPGEILVGRGTMQLARDCVTAEELEPLALKGKPEPVPAWRLLSVSADAAPRHFDSPFVGRERELQTLWDAWENARDGSLCRLVSVVGEAGLGKSRLVAEALRCIDAAVVQGRCLSYGAGITYWPVLEALTQLRTSLDAADAAVAGPLRALLDGAGTFSTDELAWAFRKFVESVARERPLVLVFDDIHWAEEALLDLIEHMTVVSTGAPILLVCMARPPLLERRPGWRDVLTLGPLTDDEAGLLVRTRLAAEDRAVADRIVGLADGNALFVEELAAMPPAALQEERVGSPTIGSLLAARLDALADDERAVIEAASIEGEVFHVGALRALLDGEPHLPALLTGLVRKNLIHPDRPVLAGEDAFRFRHLLLRDAAYATIQKRERWPLHERYAEWADVRPEPLDAFVGYHLEQAYRYRTDLLDTSGETEEIAQRASDRLETAANRAVRRSDFSAAVNLLERAVALPPVAELRRAGLMGELAAIRMEAGQLAEADGALAAAKGLAAAAGDERLRARLLVESQFLELHRAAPGATRAAPEILREIIPTLERADDQRGLSRAWQLQASSDWRRGQISAASAAWQRAARHALGAGAEHEWAVINTWIASAAGFDTTPVDSGIRLCEELQWQLSGHPACEVEVLRPLAGLHGFAGRFELARSLFATRNAVLDEIGRGLNYASSNTEASVEMLAGNYAAAEEMLQRADEALEQMRESSVRSTTRALLGRALVEQGRYDEAERCTGLAEELAEPDDLMTQILWRSAQARIDAARGDFDDAERLAHEAVTLAAATDFLNFHADALVDLAAVLDTAGRTAETSLFVAEAIRLYEQKGNVVGAAASRAHLDALAAV